MGPLATGKGKKDTKEYLSLVICCCTQLLRLPLLKLVDWPRSRAGVSIEMATAYINVVTPESAGAAV